jgi:Fic family protein
LIHVQPNLSHTIAPNCTIVFWCDLVYFGAMNEQHRLSFQPSTQLVLALKKAQAQINQLATELSRTAPAELAWLHRMALISTIGASTRIENAILTDAEIEWVDTTLSQEAGPELFTAQKTAILDKLSKDRERSIEEVVGCREMLSVVYLQAQELFPLSETTICGLHRELLRFYHDASRYAGRYKANPNQVVAVNQETGDRQTVLDPAPAGPLTESAMTDLVQWYNGILHRHPWPLLVATEFVFRFLAIHPFQDGNGRLGRALFLMALLQADDPALRQVMGCISIDRQIERHRPLYYTSLQQVADGVWSANPNDYRLEPLAWFFLRMLTNALSDVELLRARYQAVNRLSESATKVLACFRAAPERRLTVAELVASTGIVRRTVQNALRTLVAANLLQQLGAGRATRYQLVF